MYKIRFKRETTLTRCIPPSAPAEWYKEQRMTSDKHDWKIVAVTFKEGDIIFTPMKPNLALKTVALDAGESSDGEMWNYPEIPSDAIEISR